MQLPCISVEVRIASVEASAETASAEVRRSFDNRGGSFHGFVDGSFHERFY